MAISKKLMSKMAKANKELGKEIALVASDGLPPIPHISTGSHMFDLAISSTNGGLPIGKIIEVYGPESAGKTTFCLLAVAERQRYERKLAEENPQYEEKACVFVDAEHGFSPELAESYGVDMDSLILIDPPYAEAALEVLDGLIRTGDIALAVVDSVPALTPAKIEESSMEQDTIGLVARLMSKVTTKLNGSCHLTGTTVIFINQIREKIGVMYGNPETTPGGRALKFYSWLRIKVSRGKDIKNGDDVVGHEMKVHIVKNKSDIPKKVGMTNLLYNVGYSREQEILNIGILGGVIYKSGAWFSLIDPSTGELFNIEGIECKFQGQANFISAMEEVPAIYEKVYDLVELAKLPIPEEELAPEDSEE